jgi:hypothetical protein
MTIAQALLVAFSAIISAVESEKTEARRIARAKREVLALSLRLGSDALLRRMLK